MGGGGQPVAGGIRAAENVEYTKSVQYSSEAISLFATLKL